MAWRGSDAGSPAAPPCEVFATRSCDALREPAVLRRGVHRRRSLSVLRAEACLRHAMPAPVPFFLRQLDRGAAWRIPARSAAGPLLPWLLLGDDAADVRCRGD